jgi:hypothetical protein
MLKLYITGILILFIAVIANVIAGMLHVMSWYDAIVSLQQNGWNAFKQWRWMDYLWLFVLYPVILGAAGYYGLKLYEILVK